MICAHLQGRTARRPVGRARCDASRAAAPPIREYGEKPGHRRQRRPVQRRQPAVRRPRTRYRPDDRGRLERAKIVAWSTAPSRDSGPPRKTCWQGPASSAGEPVLASQPRPG